MVIEKRYYVIQNEDGFFKPNGWSEGYPVFVEDFENCKRYGSEELAKEFLKGKYATEQFKDKFIGATVRKITMLIE